MRLERGRVVREVNGFYSVWTDASGQWMCGVRKSSDKIKPCVGDVVSFECTGDREGRIVAVDVRERELIRPRIANVDVCLIVCAATHPQLQRYILDKMLVHVWAARMQPLLCVTKVDAQQCEHVPLVAELARTYVPLGVGVYAIDYRDASSVVAIARALEGRLGVLAGASGVGKSTLLNALVGDARAQTDAISTKTGRGRHATRHVQLYRLASGGWIADSPGFSQLSLDDVSMDDVRRGFPEFDRVGCAFRDCTHVHEPHCAVREAVAHGVIDATRHAHYAAMVEEKRLARKW